MLQPAYPPEEPAAPAAHQTDRQAIHETDRQGATPAGVPRRVGAWTVDVLAVGALAYAGATAAMIVAGPTVHYPAGGGSASLDPAMVVTDALIASLVSCAYFVISWRAMSASPAQRIFRLHVRGEHPDEPLSWRSAILRWLLLFPPFGVLAVSCAPFPVISTVLWYSLPVWYLVLLTSTLRNPARQGLHDRLSGTSVR